MTLRMSRWTPKFEPDEDDLIRYLTSHNIATDRWEAKPETIFEEREAVHDQTLWVAEGSLSVQAGGRHFTILAGRFLEIPAQTRYSTVAGLAGCVVYRNSHEK